MKRQFGPTLAAAATTLILVLAWLVLREPAFREVDSAATGLPIAALRGESLPPLDGPTFVLVWLPG